VATIGWQARDWDTLPALPSPSAGSGSPTSTRVATLVAPASGAQQALEVDRGTMSVWQLGGSGWQLAQTVRVPIPYGSSG